MNEIKPVPSSEDRKVPAPLAPAASGVPALRDPYGLTGGYGATPGYGSDDSGLDLLQYWRLLNKRKWLILSIAVAALTLGVVRTLMETPLYTATARLQIDRNVAKIIESGNVTPVEGGDSEFLKTQYELLQSRAIAERVASTLRLGEDPDFLKPRNFSLFGTIKGLLSPARPPAAGSTTDKRGLELAAAGVVMGNRGLRPVPGSRLVDINYTDPVPARAQRIVMAYTDAIIAANLDKRFQANSYAKTFLEDQVKQLKLHLGDAEKVLLDFAQKEQIVVVTEKASIAENNLASANAALGSLISERIKNEQLWKQVDTASGVTMPQLLTNSVIDGLRGRRNALVTEYQEKLETFKPGYPVMVQINNKIAEIDRQLASEVKTIKGSLKASYENSLNQEEEMKKRIETLRGEVLDLQKRSVQYNILKREVDTTRTIHDGLLQRYKEVDVAGGVASNNIFIVDRAEVPGSPTSPQMMSAVTFWLALGLAAGVGLAFLLERLDDRILVAETLEQISGLPTLGVVPKIAGEEAIAAELADPRSALCEAYRSLCTSLQFSTDSGLPKTLLLTSAGPGEGKSFSSFAIARHFATLGLKVLIVDADLRKPSLHKKLSLDNAMGLSNYLTGGCMVEDAFQVVSPNLVFMASGPLPPNAADLLSSSRLRSLLSVASEIFDLVVIDGPPVVGLADAQLLSSAASATIFVAAGGQARIGEVRGAMKRLHVARAVIIGCLLTKYDAKMAGYGYGYGYGYGSGYGYGGGVEDSKAHQPQLASHVNEHV